MVDIEYIEYDSEVKKVKKMEKYELNWYFTEEEQKSLNINDLYEIRSWKPFYKLASGKIIKWEYQLKHFIK